MIIDYNNPDSYWLNTVNNPYKDMNDQERLKAGCMQMVMFILMLIVGLSLCALMGSCTTTKYVPVIENHTDTLWQNHIMRDSIYLHDSTFIHDKGDTVWVEKWHTKYRDRQVHDTIYKSRTDSVPVPYPVEKLVDKPLAWWQKTLMYVGWLSILILCIWIWKTQ